MRDFQLPVLPHKLSDEDQQFIALAGFVREEQEKDSKSRLKRLEVQRGPLGIRGLNSDGSPALDPSDPYALDKAGAADLWGRADAAYDAEQARVAKFYAEERAAQAAEDIYNAANWYAA